MEGGEDEHYKAEHLIFSLKDVVMLVMFIGGLLATYFGTQASASSQMERVAEKVASQKLETVNLRLSGIETAQAQMNQKMDRLLDQFIERNDRRSRTSGEQ